MILLTDEEIAFAENLVFNQTVYGKKDLDLKIKQSVDKAQLKKLVESRNEKCI